MTSMPLPGAFAAADLPDARTATDLWGLLVWTYQTQRAGRLGLGRGLPSRHRWMDYLATLDDDGARPTIHVDAAAVHRVVCGILPPETARLVVEMAEMGEQPERCEAVPMPMAVRRDGHGGARHEVRGEWVEVPMLRITAAEEAKLKLTDDHGEVERSAVPGGALRWRYRVDLRPRRRCRRARLTITAGKIRAHDVGFAAGDDVWSPWCPVEYQPDPAYVEMVNAIHRLWIDALDALGPALAQVPFRTRRLIGYPGEAEAIDCGNTHIDAA